MGKVLRRSSGHKPETVYVLTSREAFQMDAAQWLSWLRIYWGIENGLHQRLDASAKEDESRVRTINSIWILGMFRRLGVSVYAEWRSRSKSRNRASLHDFHEIAALYNQDLAFRLVSSKSPSVKERIMK
jgi:hypothetical protein